MSDEKLQKVIARTGVTSRRQAEEWITAGRVTVDGKPAQLGQRITARQRIAIDGKPLAITEATQQSNQTLIYHKPVGEVCARTDPEQRPTVFANLPPLEQGRWIVVGRLDYNTSGLLLFTTDGDLAHQLMHPSFEYEREYIVRVFGQLSDQAWQRLLQGVNLPDGRARFEKIRELNGKAHNQWYQVSVREGRNRLVRRLLESQGLKISRLTRIRFGSIQLPRDLGPGQWRLLTPRELDQLAALKAKH